MKFHFLYLLLLLMLKGFAQSEAHFNRATLAYNEGKYDKAVEEYLKILDSGSHSAALYYNLGNSYYKLNQIAPSIYYYEKALLLDPNDREISNNLAYARNMTLDAFDEMEETGFSRIYKGFTGIMSFDQWAYAAILFMFLFVLGYIAFYYLRYSGQKRAAFIGSLFFLFFSLLSVSFAYLQYHDFQSQSPAIIFNEQVPVRSEPNNRSQEAFVLHEGSKVNVLETLNEWNKIELTDGKTGWAPAESMKLLKDF